MNNSHLGIGDLAAGVLVVVGIGILLIFAAVIVDYWLNHRDR